MVARGRTCLSRRGSVAIGLAVLVVFGTGVATGVEGRPNVSVFAPENTVAPGETTQVELELMNSGTVTDSGDGIEAITQNGEQRVQTARNVTIEAEADGPPFDVETSTVPVGSLPEGTSGSIPITLSVNDDAPASTYLLTITVEYVYTSEIEDGEETEVEETITEEVPIEVEETADFEVQSAQSDLNVGEDGEVTGSIENTGSEDATDAVLRLTTESGTIDFADREYALDDVGAGESTDFAFDADVSAEASEGERQLDFVVEYEDERGDEANATTSTQVNVGPEREEFTVSPVDATVESGATDTVELEVTNERDEDASNVNAQLFADSPLSAEDDQAYADELDAGESAILTFEVSAEDGAITKQYPLEIDFSYDDSEGDTQLSDQHQVPVEVTEPADDGFSGWAVGGLVLGLVVVGLMLGVRRFA